MNEKTSILYIVSMENPSNHYFSIQMNISNITQKSVEVSMATWTPGSYLIREYSKNIKSLNVRDSKTKKDIFWKKTKKNTWRIENKSSKEISIFYKVYANELSVRTSHLNHDHGYFNGTSLFLFIKGRETEHVILEIIPPSNWYISTGLKRINDEKYIFSASDWEELVDCPVEIGTHQKFSFAYKEVNHEVAIYGRGIFPLESIKQDIPLIVETVCSIWESDIYNTPPYDSYTFIIHLVDGFYGGLEHRNSSTSIYDRLNLLSGKNYAKFLSLICHEFFHVYNVKRIKPQAFIPYDYQNETYTRHLWMVEGVTAYYDQYLLLRCGIVPTSHYLELLAEDIQKLERTPGRFEQSIEESSFDAWIKLYRPDENSVNTTVSYYLKGELVVFCLDVMIRHRTQNRNSFDDILRYLFINYASKNIGYPEEPKNFIKIANRASSIDLIDFFKEFIWGRKDPPFDNTLDHLGLKLTRKYGQIESLSEEKLPELGVETEVKENNLFIKVIYSNSPAFKYGLNTADEILGIDKFRITPKNFSNVLAQFKPNDTIKCLVNRMGDILEIPVKLGKKYPTKYLIELVENPSEEQIDCFKNWANQDFPKL